MSRWPTSTLGDVVIARPGNGKIIKGTLPTEHDGRLFPAYSATGQDVFSEEYDHEGDGIVVSAVGARCGKCFLATGRWRAIANTHVLLPRKDKVVARFLWYLINDERFWVKGGSAQPFVKINDSLKITIPLPPLPEQERIVRILDEAETLRRLRTKADERTADIGPAVFTTSLDGVQVEHLSIGGLFERGWLRLHKDGNHGSLYPRAEEFGERGVPFLSAKSIADDGSIIESDVAFLNEEKAQQLRIGWIERGDVLLAHNASVGKVAYYDGRWEEALIGTSLTAFRADPERLSPTFLWAALRDAFFQGQLQQVMKQALRNQVPITAQRELLLRIPPREVQETLSQRITETCELKRAQAASRHRLDDLFQSLLHRAYQGDL